MLCQKPISIVASLGTMLGVLIGCGRPADMPVTSQVDPVAEEAIASEPKAPGTPIASELQAVDGKLEADYSEKQSEPNQETTEYEPPFPDRVDLFKVPRREGRGIATTTEGVEKSVELLGFVNVDFPQVVLSIDGIVTPLQEGSRVADIEVISIQPPAVVLQRGRQRWRAALEN